MESTQGRSYDRYNADVERELKEQVSFILSNGGKPVHATIIAGIIRDIKKIYKVSDPNKTEVVVWIKKALIEYIKKIDLEVGV